MAKGRKSTVQMTSEVGETREAKIAAMVAIGADNETIWAAMESMYPETIPSDDLRRKVKGKHLPTYDAKEREKLGWAIRSVKGLMMKDDAQLADLLSEFGDVQVKGIDEIQYENRERFSCGVHALDWIYGLTNYKHVSDHPKGVYKKGDPLLLPNGQQKVEHGFPFSFMSLWGGSPGVGKTRLAIALTLALNKLGKRVLYFNGEAVESDFRGWVGPNINGDLFKIYSSELVRTETVVKAAYDWQAPVIIVDSFQMLAEVAKGNRGAKTTLSRFKILKADTAAGRPHIIFISQLNKKGEMAGAKYLEHMVDGSVKVYRRDGHKSQFFFESMKMRGAECPRGALFRHVESGVECISTGMNSAPVYKLEQPTNNAIIAAGVQNAQITPAADGGGNGDE